MTSNKIYTAITNDVEVSVAPKYEVSQSNPSLGRFVFSYSVKIVNNSSHTIKLVYRDWEIYDSLHHRRLVHGDGVVGVYPTLQPGESFEYQSWCPLESGVGKMSGFYTFEDHTEGVHTKIEIPEFLLIADYILN
jgi:ApaG protein